MFPRHRTFRHCGAFYPQQVEEYIIRMTKLRIKPLRWRAASIGRSDDIARVVLQLAGSDEAVPVALSTDEQKAIAASKAAAKRGEFATDEQVRAVWAKHGL